LVLQPLRLGFVEVQRLFHIVQRPRQGLDALVLLRPLVCKRLVQRLDALPLTLFALTQHGKLGFCLGEPCLTLAGTCLMAEAKA
jgi:hypothetical protein